VTQEIREWAVFGWIASEGLPPEAVQPTDHGPSPDAILGCGWSQSHPEGFRQAPDPHGDRQQPPPNGGDFQLVRLTHLRLWAARQHDGPTVLVGGCASPSAGSDDTVGALRSLPDVGPAINLPAEQASGAPVGIIQFVPSIVGFLLIQC
jgi:hypothetical protein